MMKLWMPNQAPGMVMDGSYSGDAPQCADVCPPEGGCQKARNYPFFCDEATAAAKSPKGSAHSMLKLWMPNEAPGMVMDGSYSGMAPQCADVCPPEGGCQKNNNYPFYCDEAAAAAKSPKGSAHSMLKLGMPNEAPGMVMD